MLPEFIKKWEEGYKIVVAIKDKSEESRVMFAVRRFYYYFADKIADVKLLHNFAGFGLYDRKVLDILRQVDDPYPYFRGLICEIGFERAEIRFTQPKRERGRTSNNLYSLFDTAMLGMTSFSKVPMRMATIAGFLLSFISFVISMGYLVLKLLFWEQFVLGTAPILIGIFFFASVQLFFIGILGEYIGSIHTRVMKRPMVIEKERINC